MKIMTIKQNSKYKNHSIPIGSVLLQTENGIVYVCENFHEQKDNLFRVWIWNREKWCHVWANNDYTYNMYKFYLSELQKRKREIKKQKSSSYYANLMKHDRRHKGSGSGQRLGFTGTVTEYECTKNPLHDFRRSMYVQWN